MCLLARAITMGSTCLQQTALLKKFLFRDVKMMPVEQIKSWVNIQPGEGRLFKSK